MGLRALQETPEPPAYPHMRAWPGGRPQTASASPGGDPAAAGLAVSTWCRGLPAQPGPLPEDWKG